MLLGPQINYMPSISHVIVLLSTMWLIIHSSDSLFQRRSTQFLSKLNPLGAVKAVRVTFCNHSCNLSFAAPIRDNLHNVNRCLCAERRILTGCSHVSLRDKLQERCYTNNIVTKLLQRCRIRCEKCKLNSTSCNACCYEKLANMFISDRVTSSNISTKLVSQQNYKTSCKKNFLV